MKRGEFAAWAASLSSATAWEFLVMLTETRGGSLVKNMGQQMTTREPRISALTLGKSLPFSLLVSSSGSTEIPVLDISWLLLSIRSFIQFVCATGTSEADLSFPPFTAFSCCGL